MNYGYTSEPNPLSITDLPAFLDAYNVLEPAGPDELATVKDVAAKRRTSIRQSIHKFIVGTTPCGPIVDYERPSVLDDADMYPNVLLRAALYAGRIGLLDWGTFSGRKLKRLLGGLRASVRSGATSAGLGSGREERY